MDIEYIITKNSILFDNQRFITYGIIAIDKRSAKVRSEFFDVSFNKTFVLHLVAVLNTEKVELCHFKEIVIDELNR